MKKLHEKSELLFALLWIGLYVALMNVALQCCGGFDDLAQKTVPQLLVPVVCGAVLAVASTWWIVRNGFSERYGLCAFRGDLKKFLYFIPLILLSCVNFKNGVTLSASWSLSLLMALNMAIVGYVEEIIFRGFLFRSMAKDRLGSAIVVSAITFGVGHIVNLANTSDTLGVLLQVCYAVAIGFLYTVLVYKGGSLWPCVVSHMLVNGSSVFASEQGWFSSGVAALFGQSGDWLVESCTAVLIILLSGSYALWVWKKA